MTDKWLRREGSVWVEKNIISPEQLEEIIKLYPESPRRISQLLPILASVLIGLSLLTFVASNWNGIPDIARLILLIATTVGFYATGFVRGQISWVGQGLIGLGVVSFGASVILIGQMFHLIAYDATVFVLWSLAALGTLYLFRRTFFYLLSSALLLGGQIYSIASFDHVSWLLFILTILGLGIYSYHTKHEYAGWILSFSIGIQSIFLLITSDMAWSWITLIFFFLYVVGLALGKRPMAQGFLAWPAIFSFIFTVFMVFLHEHIYQESAFLANPFLYLPLFSILVFLAIWLSRGLKAKWLPMLLFLPLFFFTYADLAYLVILFVYSSGLIFLGDQEGNSSVSKLGVFLFMLSSFIGYVQLAWDFLDKSIFFLIGGLLLFGIHWFLRRRSQWMTKGEK
ncbi:DUF2157 domain-containing protein [Ammoniphilus sp. YIM 78166]|uniref:DUF2157 domain-containing protein n=1 Tax=Ammoniphilus sp. YIM 78166 TaxID=1644106 RepID=UPI0014306323|nr:DUF2157 domain-containing protein [Ammoniphilus sp. YIM 78166]